MLVIAESDETKNLFLLRKQRALHSAPTIKQNARDTIQCTALDLLKSTYATIDTYSRTRVAVKLSVVVMVRQMMLMIPAVCRIIIWKACGLDLSTI